MNISTVQDVKNLIKKAQDTHPYVSDKVQEYLSDRTLSEVKLGRKIYDLCEKENCLYFLDF